MASLPWWVPRRSVSNSTSGSYNSSQVSKSPRLCAANPALTFSTFSSDIAPRSIALHGPAQRHPAGHLLQQVGAESGSGTGCAPLRKQGPQALMVLGACRAALEMGPQPGDRGVGLDAGELQLHVAVQLLEAALTADLGLGRA